MFSWPEVEDFRGRTALGKLRRLDATVFRRRVLAILTDCTGSAFGSAAAGSVSAHVGCPLLLLKIIGALRLRWQLKHGRLLSLG